jgi:hypothetical protein
MRRIGIDVSGRYHTTEYFEVPDDFDISDTKAVEKLLIDRDEIKIDISCDSYAIDSVWVTGRL